MKVRKGYYSEQARNESYLTIEDLGRRQKQVYEVICNNPGLSNEMIAEKLGLRINSVTGRVKELRDAEFIELFGHTYSTSSGKKVCLWRAKEVQLAIKFEQ